jgi:glycosyltransferase involved in cell wall biosynthesis
MRLTRWLRTPGVEALAARLFFGVLLLRLRLDRIAAVLTGQQGCRVAATACWSFPIYSQTFVYQELTQLIRGGFAVRFLYSNLNRQEPFSSQFMPLWRARRRLTLHPAVCDRSIEYYTRRMPGRVDELLDALSRAAGMSKSEIRSHLHVRQAFAFTRFIDAYRPDYLHSYFFYEGSLYVLVASWLLDIPRGVSCYADHMLDDYALKVVPVHLRQSSVTIATSEHIKRELLQLAPAADARRILVKPNGINVARFPLIDRTTWPQGSGPYSLVTVSRIEPKKGLVYLIEAVGLLRERGLDVELRVIGGVDDTDASRDCHLELEATIARLGLAAHVRLEGKRSEAEINARFRDAHVFVAPFVETDSGDKDGVPTALLEAMASGLPVVATDAGSILEVIDHEVDGLIVRQRDPRALADGIAALLASPSRRRALGTEGARKVAATFNALTCEQVFHDRLRQLTAGSLAGRRPEPSVDHGRHQ